MDESRKKSAGPVVAAVLMVLLLFPLLYVLSIGPAAWLVEREVVSGEKAELFYCPILAAAQYSPGVQPVLEWYIELFI